MSGMRRLGWLLLVLVIALPLLGAAAALVAVRVVPERLKPLIVTLVERGGRQRIALAGPLRLVVSTRPRLIAEDVTLSNRDGRLTARHLTAEIALAPLFSRREIVVERLTLDRATLYPVATATPAAPPPLAAAQQAAPAAPATPRAPRPWRIRLQALRLTNSQVIGVDPRHSLTLTELDLPAWPGPRASDVTLDAIYAGIPFSVTGMIARLPGPAVALSALRIVAAQGDVALDGTLSLGPHPGFSGKVSSQRLDLDAIRHALPRRPHAAPLPEGAAPATGAPSPQQDWRDQNLPFAALGGAEGDVTLALREVIESGAVYRDIALHAVLREGKLVIDPARLVLPGGPATLSLKLDAISAPPLVHFRATAPALALGPLAAAFHWPADNAGALEAFADLAARGETMRALRATLSGKFGIAAVNAELDNRLLLLPLAKMLRRAHIPPLALAGEGKTALRCFALRADLSDGHASLRAGLLQTSRLDLGAAGTLDLAAGTLALQLAPSVRIGGNALVVPIRLDGAIDDPQPVPDESQQDGALAAQPCRPALALARDGRAGPEPGPRKPDKGLSLHDLLRGLVK